MQKMNPSSAPKSLEQGKQFGFTEERMAFIYTDRNIAVANMLLGSWKTALLEHHCILR